MISVSILVEKMYAQGQIIKYLTQVYETSPKIVLTFVNKNKIRDKLNKNLIVYYNSKLGTINFEKYLNNSNLCISEVFKITAMVDIMPFGH